MIIHWLIQLLADIESGKDQDAIIRDMDRVFALSKFNYYGLIMNPKPQAGSSSTILMEHWPAKWLEIYAAKKYDLINPAVRFLTQSQKPFRLQDCMIAFSNDPHRRKMEQMLTEAHRHGLEDSYMFPIHGRNGLLGRMVIASSAPVELSAVEISLFHTIAHKAFWRLLEVRGEAGTVDQAPVIENALTKRELEILQHLAQGLTSIDISKIIKLSNHTVDWYMNRIQAKLGAKNRQQVVAFAFRQGLIA